MNQYITNIINYGVKLIVQALSLIPGLTQEVFNEAIDLAVTQLQSAKDTFAVTEGQTVAQKGEAMVYNALEIAQNSCDAAGDTKADGVFVVLENVDTEIENGSFNIIKALGAWIDAKKAAKAATPSA